MTALARLAVRVEANVAAGQDVFVLALDVEYATARQGGRRSGVQGRCPLCERPLLGSEREALATPACVGGVAGADARLVGSTYRGMRREAERLHRPLGESRCGSTRRSRCCARGARPYAANERAVRCDAKRRGQLHPRARAVPRRRKPAARLKTALNAASERRGCKPRSAPSYEAGRRPQPWENSNDRPEESDASTRTDTRLASA